MPAEQPKEALTQIDVERKRVEFAERYGLEFSNEVTELYKAVAGKYGKEVADYLSQDKIEIKKLAELYGIKLKHYYSFPELENSLINRLRFAQAIDEEGCIQIHCSKRGEKYHYLWPILTYVNTSKGLVERGASWMRSELPKPKTYREGELPIYRLEKSCAPAIYLVCLARFGLVKKENVEKADRIIRMFKESPTIRCDENGNPISPPEPKYVRAHRLRQEGLPYNEVADRLGCSLDSAHSLVWHAKNLELHRERRREYYKQRSKGV